MYKDKIAIIGAGGWGTAIAETLAVKNSNLMIWAREKEVVESINKDHFNSMFLSFFRLSEHIKASDNLKEVVEGAKMIFFVVPSEFMVSIVDEISRYDISFCKYFISATKGIDSKLLMFSYDVAKKYLPAKLCESFIAMSGPTFAKEVIAKYPTAMTLASNDKDGIEEVSDRISTTYLRTYLGDDIIGLEVAGAYKNVIAIAAGVSDALNLGNNARAGLVTRGLAETMRFGRKLGAKERTFIGLSGVGDLLLTAMGDLSRNRNVGLRIGRGEPLQLKDSNEVAEGVKTSFAISTMAKKLDVATPIADKVYSVLYKGEPAEHAVRELMERSQKDEFYE